MGDRTGIEWSDATWNPVAGCTKVSAGCKHCYAERMAWRLRRMEESRGESGVYGAVVDERGRWNGRMVVNEASLALPLRWKKPRAIFVNSMSDLFHEGVADEFIDRVFAVMALCPQHTFLVLTKRATRMAEYMTLAAMHEPANKWCVHDAVRDICDRRGIPMPFDRSPAAFPWPLPNVCLGVSVENQEAAEQRIPSLLATPAAVRFISAEPLLGAVRLRSLNVSSAKHVLNSQCWTYIDSLTGTHTGYIHGEKKEQAMPHIDGVICGGESGLGARATEAGWVRSLRDDCAAAGVKFFFKQWGEWLPIDQFGNEDCEPQHFHEAPKLYLRAGSSFPGSGPTGDAVRLGKQRAGRALDGVTHDALPWRLG